MKRIYAVYLTSILLGILSCNTSAEMSAPNVYNKNGIRFLYPDSWRVTEDSENSEVRYLYVKGPANAILVIQVYSLFKAVSLSEYANWFSELARNNTSVSDRTEGRFDKFETVLNKQPFKGIREHFALSLLGKETPYTAEYYRIEKGNTVAFLVSQAATKEMNKVKAGFDILIGSFTINESEKQ